MARKQSNQIETQKGFFYPSSDGKLLPWTPEREAAWLDEQNWQKALRDFPPEKPWHRRPATPAQIALLERRGFRPPEGVSQGEASWVLDRPTPRQRGVLEERGLWDEGLTFDQAREIMERLARERAIGCGTHIRRAGHTNPR
jgi:hypothetical protein